MPRILVVTRSIPEHLGSGGMERVTFDLAARLSRNNAVTILTTPLPGRPSQWLVDDLRVEVVERARSGRYSLRWWIGTARYSGLADFDQVISASAGAMMMILFRSLRSSTVITHSAPAKWHLSNVLRDRPRRWVRRSIKYLTWTFLDLLTYFKATRVEVASDRLRDLYTEWPYRLAWRRTELVVSRHAIDNAFYAMSPEKRSAARSRFGLDDTLHVLSVISRLEWLKGADRAVDLMAALPENFRLVIGGDGEELKNLERQAVDLGVDDRVMFLGKISREDVRDVYHASDLFLFPVRSFQREGLPLTVLEAVTSGVRAVVPSESSWPDDLQERLIYADMDDPRSLIRAVVSSTDG